MALTIANWHVIIALRRMNIMVTVVDKFGRIVIPKKIREDLGITPGSAVHIEEIQDEIRRNDFSEEFHVEREGGILVIRGVAEGSIDDALEKHREEYISKSHFKKNKK